MPAVLRVCCRCRRRGHRWLCFILTAAAVASVLWSRGQHGDGFTAIFQYIRRATMSCRCLLSGRCWFRRGHDGDTNARVFGGCGELGRRREAGVRDLRLAAVRSIGCTDVRCRIYDRGRSRSPHHKENPCESMQGRRRPPTGPRRARCHSLPPLVRNVQRGRAAMMADDDDGARSSSSRGGTGGLWR